LQRRTAFFDDETLGAIHRGTTQIVIVAAGYDGRALRFATPAVRWWEVDHPATQADKRRRLADAGIQAPSITFVPVDLTRDDLVASLADAGHDPALPSLFVVEGLLGYLPRDVSAGLLSSTRAVAAEGSRLAVAFPIVPHDLSISETIALRVRETAVATVGEPRLDRFGPEEPDQLLEAAGWKVSKSDRVPGGLARYEGRQGVLVAAEPA